MSNILKQVYSMILNEEFTYGSFEKRLKLQKTVYLLENIGVSVGGYGFSWYKHGPYSQELQDDAFYDIATDNVNLSEEAKGKIEILKKYVSECEGTEYSKSNWLEDLASLYYLKFRMKIDQKELLDRLTKMKPHLNNEKMNQRALLIIDEINNLVA